MVFVSHSPTSFPNFLEHIDKIHEKSIIKTNGNDSRKNALNLMIN